MLRDMVQSIYSLLLPLRLASLGMVLSKVGAGSLCLLLGCLLVQFSIFALLFCKLGRGFSLRMSKVLSLPGPPGFLHRPWMQVPSGCISGSDIAAWPSSVVFFSFYFLFKYFTWPVDTDDMGHFGVSYLEVLILFEHWLGHRLLSEKVTRMHLRADRPICFPPVPVSEGIQIRQGCQFICSLFRALGKLSGGVGRFIPCAVGGHMSRLRHLGWLQCSHGLTSRPLDGVLSSRMPSGSV